MLIPQWIPYTAAGAVVLYSLCLIYWVHRVLWYRHPIDDTSSQGKFWRPTFWILLFALAGTEVPAIALFVILVCSFVAWTLYPYMGYGCAALAAFAAALYLIAEHIDRRRSRAEREQRTKARITQTTRVA